MSFRTESTLAGYARAAVDLRARMTEYTRSRFAQQHLKAYLEPSLHATTSGPDDNAAVLDAFSRAAHQPWQDGEPYVLAPAMTAIIAAAAQALDLTGDIIGNDVATADYAPHLAMHNADVAATTPVALHDPDAPHIGDNEWAAVPPDIAKTARTTTLDAAHVALALLDRDQLTVVGPFSSIAAADAWQPATDGWPPVDRLLLAVHAPVTWE